MRPAVFLAARTSRIAKVRPAAFLAAPQPHFSICRKLGEKNPVKNKTRVLIRHCGKKA